MLFSKRLRDGVRRGEITCSVRFWTRPRVRVGASYPMEDGEIQIDSIEPIGLRDITPKLARECGFLGVVDLLKVAKHGKGEQIYLVRFHYSPRRRKASPATQYPEFDIVRRIGRRLPEVEEGTMYGTPALKLHGRLVACVASNKSAEPGSLVVRTDFEERAALLAEQPEIYYLKDHYVNHPVVLVRLSRIGADQLGDLLSSARRFVLAHESRRKSQTRSGRRAATPTALS